MKNLIGLFILVCSLIGQVSLAADTGIPKTLRIGSSASYPPLAFMQDGQFAGIEADLAKALQQNLNINTRVIVLERDELIPALLNNKIDIIMSGMSITDERSNKVRFTDPYMEVGQMALIRNEQLVQWSQPRALFREGAKIGVIEGTTGETYVRGTLSDASVSAYADIEPAIRALGEKKIDVFVHDAPTIWRLTAQTSTQQAGLMGLFRPLTDEYLAWAVRPQDTVMAATLNAQISKLLSNGSMDRITRRWIPVSVKVGN